MECGVLTTVCRGLQEGAGADGHGRDRDEVAGCAGADLQAVLRRLLHHGAPHIASPRDVTSNTSVPNQTHHFHITCVNCIASGTWPSRHCTRAVASDAELPAVLQGAEASGGMVNIRADEELTPEEVLQGFSDADAQDVEAMVQDPQVSVTKAHITPVYCK